MLHFHMYIPEYLRKTLGFLCSKVYEENIGQKRVSLHNYWNKKERLFYIFCIPLKLFSTMMFFFTQWEHKENFDFLMFFRGLKMQHWAKIESFNIFGTIGSYFVRNWCILSEICYFDQHLKWSSGVTMWWPYIMFNLIRTYVSYVSEKLLKNKSFIDLLYKVTFWYKWVNHSL